MFAAFGRWRGSSRPTQCHQQAGVVPTWYAKATALQKAEITKDPQKWADLKKEYQRREKNIQTVLATYHLTPEAFGGLVPFKLEDPPCDELGFLGSHRTTVTTVLDSSSCAWLHVLEDGAVRVASHDPRAVGYFLRCFQYLGARLAQGLEYGIQRVDDDGRRL
jgi:hypothetical protein